MPRYAVIFDLDGTLVDTAPDLMAATNHVLHLLGRRALGESELRRFVGHGAKALIQRGATATGGSLDEASLQHMYAEFLRYYTAHIADYSVIFPGLIPVLTKLQEKGVALGVCTNKLENLAKRLLDALNLTPYFGAIVGPDSFQMAKPDPRPYFETLKILNVDPAHSLLVGDSETDILTARHAHVPVIAVSFGYTPAPVASYHPDHIIDHYNQIWPLLEHYKIVG